MLCWSKKLIPIQSCYFFFFKVQLVPRGLKDYYHGNQNLVFIFLFKNPLPKWISPTPFHTTPKNKSWNQREDDQVPWVSQLLSSPLPGWSQWPLQREQTEGLVASASLSLQLAPSKLGQKAHTGMGPKDMSGTFPLSPLSSHCFNIWVVLGKDFEDVNRAWENKNNSIILHLIMGLGVPPTTTREVKGCAQISTFSTIFTSLTDFYVILLLREVPIHSLVVKCLYLQQFWPHAIPQSQT